MNKKIGFTGPFADVNFGDYAMLVNNVFDIDIKDITLFSYDTEFLQTIKKDYFYDHKVEIVDVRLKDNVNIVNLSKERLLTPFELLDAVSNHEELTNYINNLDVLVVNGGGYFNSVWSMPHRIERLVKIIAPALIANELNKKIVFTGIGIGPFSDDGDFFGMFFNSLNNSKIHVRDELFSEMWLKELGYTKDVNNVPDDFFFINEKLINIEERRIIKEDYILLETYLTIDYLKENIEQLQNFTNKMFDKYRVKTVFVPFNLHQGGMNQALYLKDNLDNFEIIDIRDKGYLPINDLANLTKNAKLTISTRYHALVTALSLKSPIVSIMKDVMGDSRYYYNKNAGIIRHAFKNQSINENKYLSNDFMDALNHIVNNYTKILDYQNKKYNNLYDENLINLEQKRNKLLNRIKEKV